MEQMSISSLFNATMKRARYYHNKPPKNIGIFEAKLIKINDT